MWLDPDRPDPWGLPTINVSMSYRDNERRVSEQMMADAVEMLEAADVEEVSGFNRADSDKPQWQTALPEASLTLRPMG